MAWQKQNFMSFISANKKIHFFCIFFAFFVREICCKSTTCYPSALCHPLHLNSYLAYVSQIISLTYPLKLQKITIFRKIQSLLKKLLPAYS